jgi:aliphatic nitrilase
VAANRTRAAAHSFEAKAFSIVCAGYMDKRMRDFLVDRNKDAADILDATPRAASFVVDPTGAQLGGHQQDQEGIVYADLDLEACIEPKQFHDVVGYYNRFDIFDLRITRSRTRVARMIDGEPQLHPLLIDDAVHPSRNDEEP